MKEYLKLLPIIILLITCLPSNADDYSLNRVENKVNEWESEGWYMINTKSHNRAIKKLHDFYEKVKDSNNVILSGYYRSSDKNISYALLRCRIGAAYQWALLQPYYYRARMDEYGIITVPYDYMRYRDVTTSDAVKIIFPYLQEEFAIQKYQNDSLAVEAYYAINTELQERLRIEYEQIARVNWDNYEKSYNEQFKEYEEKNKDLQKKRSEKESNPLWSDSLAALIRQFISQDTTQTEKAETPIK